MTEITHVEIDSRIREHPELERAVTEATKYLEEQAVDEPPPTTISWRYADTDGKMLQLTLSDTANPSGRMVQRNYWTRWVLDPVSQKICVLKSWGELLGKRSDSRVPRINQLIAKLREEFANGREDVG